uniref:GRAM domain containing 2B n=1 Tax=Pipistrellus kuhlii TaxID=59472 RepID=A0A7J7YWI3_PIPKU|nr:GRAM domain containing 2B [Pipistrellus kuhlii]
MVKKRRSSSDTEFKFDVPSSPDKACEAQPGAPDSPGSVFLSVDQIQDISLLAVSSYVYISATPIMACF